MRMPIKWQVGMVYYERGVYRNVNSLYSNLSFCHILSLLFKGAYWFTLVELSFTRELNREPSAFFTYLFKVWLDAIIEFNKPVLFHFWYYSGLFISNLTKTMDRKKFARHRKKSDWMGKKPTHPQRLFRNFFPDPPLKSMVYFRVLKNINRRTIIEETLDCRSFKEHKAVFWNIFPQICCKA